MQLKMKLLILIAFNMLAYLGIAIGASVRSTISMAPEPSVYPREALIVIAICWLVFSLPTAALAIRQRRNISKPVFTIAFLTLLFPLPCALSHPYLCSLIITALR